jgi:hypothetical protein
MEGVSRARDLIVIGLYREGRIIKKNGNNLGRGYQLSIYSTTEETHGKP